MARERELHDHWFREAQRVGFRSRAAYKLTEIDDRRSVLTRGDRVLDCGCAPGSWIQVAAERIGRKGVVVGIDLKPVTFDDDDFADDAATVITLQADLCGMTADELLAAAGTPIAPFDVVLSDMAPNTTGDRTIDHHGSMRLCHAVLDRCRGVLREGGIVVLKALEGEAYAELLTRMKSSFDGVRGFKPKASRAVSTEMFVIGTGWLGVEDGPETDRAAVGLPPKRGPSRGWSDQRESHQR